ncbi:prepilin-type N-terminal cleavage/methylation domain-containing protein [Candidatus Poribacteria bacterium]|nr:prepilin-type N-terminal cleavage/methylation domain-containing protein [Candidatus Poribacteria bacterium]
MGERSMNRMRAFTLIELLMVVTMIAILAGIAVPNFLEAQVRSKTTRMQGDMAALAAGLRAYFADYNQYPANTPEIREFLAACAKVPLATAEAVPTPHGASVQWSTFHFSSQELDFPEDQALQAASEQWTTLPPFGPDQLFPVLTPAGGELCALTTPVSYLLVRLPNDNFADSRGTPVRYLNMTEFGTARGASSRYLLRSCGPSGVQSLPDFINPVSGPFIEYDPTNGTVSAGAMYLFGR